MKNYSPEVLFALARYAIEKEFGTVESGLPNLEEKYLEDRACFVTLTLNNQLRGCIGSLVPYQSLKDDVLSNAYNAAFKDHRFSALTEVEYSQSTLSISVLTIPQPVLFEGKEDLQRRIQPHRDGVVLTCMGKRSTFLPHVWDQLPDFDLFFRRLFEKAGVTGVPDYGNCSIQSYQVEKYDEG